MDAMSRFVLRHKGAVMVFWLVVLVAGGAACAKLSGRLSPSFALPGAPGYQAGPLPAQPASGVTAGLRP